MALFESYERRIEQINAELEKHGISSIEEAKQICDDKGVDAYQIVKDIQPICFENACWAYTVGAAIAIKDGCTNAENGKRIRLLQFLRLPAEFFIAIIHLCQGNDISRRGKLAVLKFSCSSRRVRTPGKQEHEQKEHSPYLFFQKIFRLSSLDRSIRGIIYDTALRC